MRKQLSVAGNAYQFLDEDDAVINLKRVQLPTGEIQIQRGDAMNGIEARCYVPTTWGTLILEPGDWIFVTDEGYVIPIRQKAQEYLRSMTREEVIRTSAVTQDAPTKVLDTVEAEHAEPVFTQHHFHAEAGSFLLQEIAVQNHYDWLIERHESRDGRDDFRLVLGATGRELGRWKEDDHVVVFSDGSVTVNREES